MPDKAMIYRKILTDGKLKKLGTDAIVNFMGLIIEGADNGCGCLKYDIIEIAARCTPGFTEEKVSKVIEGLISYEILIVYKKYGRLYLCIRNFHNYQFPTHPPAPKVPIPYWVKWVTPSERGKSEGVYELDEAKMNRYCDYLKCLDKKEIPEIDEVYKILELGQDVAKKKNPQKTVESRLPKGFTKWLDKKHIQIIDYHRSDHESKQRILASFYKETQA